MSVNIEMALKIEANEVKDWDGNPREMWVWDDDMGVKSSERMFVVYINPDKSLKFPVITDNGAKYSHCAEIVEEEKRLMTNRELARWLREKPDREYKRIDCFGDNVFSVHNYRLLEEDEQIGKDVYVREGDSPWLVPFASLLEGDGEY